MSANTLTHCRRCNARYDPTVTWVTGYRRLEDTTGTMVVTGRIRGGDCPVCRKPPGTGPMEEFQEAAAL